MATELYAVVVNVHYEGCSEPHSIWSNEKDAVNMAKALYKEHEARAITVFVVKYLLDGNPGLKMFPEWPGVYSSFLDPNMK